MLEVKKSVSRALEKELKANGFSAEQILEMLEVPPSKELGDIAFPVFKLAPIYKKSPVEIAKELASKIRPGKEITKIRPEGPYVNFFVDQEFLSKNTLKEVFSADFGKGNANNGKKIVLEYSQPNTNKPLHVGHLRNNALGMAVSNLLGLTGAKVTKVDLFNDRGIHICQSMLAYKKWGNGSTPEKEGLKSDHFVGKFYVLYHKMEKELPELKGELSEMLQNWENSDKETLALWKKMNAWAEEGFLETYKEFGSEFDNRFKESEFFRQAQPIIELGVKKGIFAKDEDNSVVCDLEKFGLGKKIIMRGDGTSVYVTQDLALAKKKFDMYKFDKSVYVVASEQNTYFKQLFKILELLGFQWSGKLFHLSYGLVNLREGKLKSREGKIIDADNLIKDVTGLARKEIVSRFPDLPEKEVEKRAREIGLAAIKFYMLKTDAVKDILFEPAKAVSFEGDTGPYLQYTYARAKSIERKAKSAKRSKEQTAFSEEENAVLSLISRFPEIVSASAEGFSTHTLANYLLELASAFNSFYHKHRVISDKNEFYPQRLELVKGTAIVLKKGLNALNISVLEEM
ncbi:MAG: arginine--tRNA ligase [Candidatus Diapherotrites archaeon]|nr:arginine--tRNA ligase [Candidatus Diapherotrites archaeon]